MIKVPIQSHTLGNDLQVILAPAHDFPIVAVTVAYQVGSVNEEPGKSGFAHLFEHLMFQGSANVPRNGHFKMVDAAGGSLNAFTTKERTIYFEALPAHQRKLGLWLEADRMRSLAITQENFDTERSTVKEERRQSYDNRPYGRAYEELDALAHDDPAYAHSVIGSMADLDRASLADVQAFWSRFYTPSNALLVVVGDFDPAEMIDLAAHYFEDIPARPRPAPPRRRRGARPTRNRERRLTDALAELPATFMALPVPAATSRDWYAARLLREILTSGDSSRLYRRLVKGERLAVQVSTHIEQHRGPALLFFVALMRPGAQSRTRQALLGELDAVARDGVTPAELDKAKNKLGAGYVGSLSSCLQRGVQIATLALLHGRADALNHELARYQAVTNGDVRRVARKLVDSIPAWLTVTPGGRAA